MYRIAMTQLMSEMSCVLFCSSVLPNVLLTCSSQFEITTSVLRFSRQLRQYPRLARTFQLFLALVRVCHSYHLQMDWAPCRRRSSPPYSVGPRDSSVSTVNLDLLGESRVATASSCRSCHETFAMRPGCSDSWCHHVHASEVSSLSTENSAPRIHAVEMNLELSPPVSTEPPPLAPLLPGV